MRHVLLTLLVSRRMCWLVPAGIGVALLALLATPARSQYPYHPYARTALQQQIQQQQMLQALRQHYLQQQQWQLRQQALHASAPRTVPHRPATKSQPASPVASRAAQPVVGSKTKSVSPAALTQPKTLKTYPAASWRPKAEWASTSSWSRTESVTYTPFGNLYGQWSSSSLSPFGGTSSYVSTSNWVSYGGPLGFDAGVTVTRTIVTPWGGYSTQVYSVDLQTLQQIALSRAIGTSVLWLGIMNNNAAANEG
jgi:hypothetical protein